MVIWRLYIEFEGGVGEGGGGFVIFELLGFGGDFIFLVDDIGVFLSFVKSFLGLWIGLGWGWWFILEIVFWGIGGGFFLDGICILVFWEFILGKLYVEKSFCWGIFMGVFEYFIELLYFFNNVFLWFGFGFIL